jgi:hypothetical protein
MREMHRFAHLLRYQEVPGWLSPRDRLILLWRMDERLTFREIGRRLGCSGVAAYKAWERAKERLERGPEPPPGGPTAGG